MFNRRCLEHSAPRSNPHLSYYLKTTQQFTDFQFYLSTGVSNLVFHWSENELYMDFGSDFRKIALFCRNFCTIICAIFHFLLKFYFNFEQYIQLFTYIIMDCSVFHWNVIFTEVAMYILLKQSSKDSLFTCMTKEYQNNFFGGTNSCY